MTGNGVEPVRDFLRTLPPPTRAKVDMMVERLNMLRANAPVLPFPHSSQVEGRLRELRCHHGKTLYRVLYRRRGDSFVLLHVFEKTTGKIPEDESSPIGTAHVRAMAEEAAADPEYQVDLARLEFSEGIARELIRIRMQLKLTQGALAHRVGTTPSVISRLERGDHEPSTATLRKIAEATGTRLLISFAPRRRSHDRPRRAELELRPGAGPVGARSRQPTEAIGTRR